MTDEQIKEMLNGIINNGERWEYRWCTADGWSNWKEYKLGSEIHANYEYRKIEKRTWLEEMFPMNGNVSRNIANNNSRFGAAEVCKKILEEVDKKVVFKDFDNYESGSALCITLDNLEQIIKDLGVEL